MASQQATARASIVVPTRARPDYLKVALASIAPQARAAQAELIVVDDAGPTQDGRRLAERFGARYEAHVGPMGLNHARNTGIERSSGALLVFVDDDVEVWKGWLGSLLAGAAGHPDVDVFTGPIVARLEGAPPRSCGRENSPITSLQLGERDCDTRYAWGANMAVRRRAFERLGPFDVSLQGAGDEQEWQDRLHRDGGRVRYLAGAGLDHRRSASDARLRALSRAAYERGRSARRFDASSGSAPGLPGELRTLAGCLGHVVRRRCPAGLTMAAHSAGRVREALLERPLARAHAGAHTRGRPPHSNTHEDFLTGESGTVAGVNRTIRAAIDASADALQTLSGQRRRVRRAARREPPTRRVLALQIERPERRELALAIRQELERSRHEVQLRVGAPRGRGKFESLNELLEGRAPREHDWLLIVDDDIVLPQGFLDGFLFLAERFGFQLAQPAHTLASHAAWRVTRRRVGGLARQTQFVEIGPLTAFAAPTFEELLPFPALRMGWGLDVHWAALARAEGWRCGIVDALPVRHLTAPAASAYSRSEAVAEAREFLAERPYLSAREAQRTLVSYRRL